MSLTDLFATRAQGMKASEIRELLKLLDQPGVISFAGGIPDPALFPVPAFRAATERALSGPAAAQGLQYSTSEGHAGLRRWIAGYMAGLGVACSADNILITSGSQQALDYLGKLFLSPGDTALVQWPTYLGALGAFNAYEPRYDRLVPGDNRPLHDIRAAAHQSGGRVKFAYVTPDFANPTGQTLTADQRQGILTQANALDCAVIEDAAYCALRYDGQPVPPILALELRQTGDLNACRTVFCGSFSKTLSPGLRVGWVCAARDVIDKLVLLKQASDLHCATLNQSIVADVADTLFEDHVDRLRNAYRKRRDAMLDALAAYMPENVEWSRPEGGMFVWVTLPDELDGAKLLQRALAAHNIAFVPGAAFFPDGSGRNSLRLNFSTPDEAQIDEGIARLGQLLQ